MDDYTIFRRVPGSHPRLHAVGSLRARSRPDALRRYGLPNVPSRRAQYVRADMIPADASGALYMAERTSAIDFDYQAQDGSLALVIASIARRKSSAYGNPAFKISFTDGSSMQTMSNAGFCYAIGNHDMREGSRVLVRLTATGRIRSMRPQVSS